MVGPLEAWDRNAIIPGMEFIVEVALIVMSLAGTFLTFNRIMPFGSNVAYSVWFLAGILNMVTEKTFMHGVETGVFWLPQLEIALIRIFLQFA